MTTQTKEICATCGHLKGSHCSSGKKSSYCRVKVKGRLCQCKKFKPKKKDVILQDPKTKRFIMTEETFRNLK